MKYSIDDIDAMINYIALHWYDYDDYSDLNLFIDKRYNDLVIWHIMQIGVINSEICENHVKSIEKLIESYYEDIVSKLNIDKQIIECLNGVKIYINKNNECLFIDTEIHSITEKELNNLGFCLDNYL